jgi:hypothetical protein
MPQLVNPESALATMNITYDMIEIRGANGVMQLRTSETILIQDLNTSTELSLSFQAYPNTSSTPVDFSTLGNSLPLGRIRRSSANAPLSGPLYFAYIEAGEVEDAQWSQIRVGRARDTNRYSDFAGAEVSIIDNDNVTNDGDSGGGLFRNGTLIGSMQANRLGEQYYWINDD